MTINHHNIPPINVTMSKRNRRRRGRRGRGVRDTVRVPFNQLSTLTFSSSVASIDIAPTSGGFFGSRIVSMGDLFRFYRPLSLKVTITPTLGPGDAGTDEILCGIAFGTGFTAPTGVGGFDFLHQVCTGTNKTSPTTLSVPNCRPYLSIDWYETEAASVPSTDTAGVIFFLDASVTNGSIILQLSGVIEFSGALDASVSLNRLLARSIPRSMSESVRDMHLNSLGLHYPSEEERGHPALPAGPL